MAPSPAAANNSSWESDAWHLRGLHVVAVVLGRSIRSGGYLSYAVGRTPCGEKSAADPNSHLEEITMTLTLAPDLHAEESRASRIIAAASVLALVLLAAPTSASAQSRLYETNNLGNPASIEGSWIFKIDVSLAQQPVGTFNSLISFAAGGIVVTTPSVPPLSI